MNMRLPEKGHLPECPAFRGISTFPMYDTLSFQKIDCILNEVSDAEFPGFPRMKIKDSPVGWWERSGKGHFSFPLHKDSATWDVWPEGLFLHPCPGQAKADLVHCVDHRRPSIGQEPVCYGSVQPTQRTDCVFLQGRWAHSVNTEKEVHQPDPTWPFQAFGSSGPEPLLQAHLAKEHQVEAFGNRWVQRNP